MPTKPKKKCLKTNEDNKEISLDPQKIFNGSIWKFNGKVGDGFGDPPRGIN